MPRAQVSIRWSFDVTSHGLLVAYEIDMKNKKSVLASIDQSFEQAHIPTEDILRGFHATFKKVVVFYLQSIKKASRGRC